MKSLLKKKCYTCKKDKLLKEFYKHRADILPKLKLRGSKTYAQANASR